MIFALMWQNSIIWRSNYEKTENRYKQIRFNDKSRLIETRNSISLSPISNNATFLESIYYQLTDLSKTPCSWTNSLPPLIYGRTSTIHAKHCGFSVITALVQNVKSYTWIHFATKQVLRTKKTWKKYRGNGNNRKTYMKKYPGWQRNEAYGGWLFKEICM